MKSPDEVKGIVKDVGLYLLCLETGIFVGGWGGISFGAAAVWGSMLVAFIGLVGFIIWLIAR